MEGLTTKSIVGVWEDGELRQPIDQALLVLWAAGTKGDPAELPLAERDRRLLELRAATFGPSLAALADCPGCSETIEVELDAHELASAIVVREPESLDVGERATTIRPLNSHDLAAACHLATSGASAGYGEVLCKRLSDLDEITDAEKVLVTSAIEEREAESEVRLALVCARCETEWTEVFDPVGHLWSEIQAAARSSLREIAELAAAFGWSEAEIFAMSAARRRNYLAMIGDQR